jgi:hypothetical protein
MAVSPEGTMFAREDVHCEVVGEFAAVTLCICTRADSRTLRHRAWSYPLVSDGSCNPRPSRASARPVDTAHAPASRIPPAPSRT